MTKKIKYFDHRLGEQNSDSNPVDIKMLKRIIKAHSEDFQRIGLHLRIKRHLEEPIKQIKP